MIASRQHLRPAAVNVMSSLVQKKITELEALDTSGLRMLWGKIFEQPPPKSMRRDLLLRALAYHVQEQKLGGLKPAVRRRLARAAQDLRLGQRPTASPSRVKAGTRLLREWQGVVHEVIVLEEGVRYRDRTWRSLSAVAREITGARWSGPLFFGLKGRRP
jgi:hypothetical protein